MGRQRNASCSSGGNGTRGSQPAWTEHVMEMRPGIPRNGGNILVFDRPCSERGPVDREACGVPQNGGNGSPTVETGVLLIGRVWRTAKRRKRTSYGRNGGPVDREGRGVPQNRGNGLVLERYGRNGGPVHREGCGVPQNGGNRLVLERYGQPPIMRQAISESIPSK